MAIFIQINRLADNSGDVVYEFGTADDVVGRVLLNKSDGRVELLGIAQESASRMDYYLSRVTRVLARHHAAGEYPERTDYRA